MTPIDPSDPGAFLSAILQVVTQKQWGYALALGVMCLVWAARKFGAKIHPAVETFLKSDPGGVLLALFVAFAAALFSGGGALSGAVLLTASKAALVAMGGFALINKLFVPIVKILLAKIWPSRVEAIEQDASVIETTENQKPAEDAAASLEQIK